MFHHQLITQLRIHNIELHQLVHDDQGNWCKTYPKQPMQYLHSYITATDEPSSLKLQQYITASPLSFLDSRKSVPRKLHTFAKPVLLRGGTWWTYWKVFCVSKKRKYWLRIVWMIREMSRWSTDYLKDRIYSPYMSPEASRWSAKCLEVSS